MKFRVQWDSIVRFEVMVEATSKEEAARMVESGDFDTDTVEQDESFQGITSVKIAHLNKGDEVNVSKYGQDHDNGLAYPAFRGVLLHDAGSSQGWDCVDVLDEHGEIVSVYCFSLER